MGRPYRKELGSLEATYDWARKLDIAGLEGAVRATAEYPLVAVGSGGALVAAEYCATVHQTTTGNLARAMTPLEAVDFISSGGQTCFGLFSAGGRNVDVRSVIRAVELAESRRGWVVTGVPGSPLAQASSRLPGLHVEAHRVPAGKDGFLATNSLLAFCVLIQRAYAPLSPVDATLPGYLRLLDLPRDGTKEGAQDRFWSADTVFVLHGPATRAAALDFQTRCTEAALARVQVADFRNFAHGRHHWLAKNRSTAVLAFITPDDRRIAEATIRLLPSRTCVRRLNLGWNGPNGCLQGLVASMHMVLRGGELKGIDPGRPGVPDFGRKLYSMKLPTTPRQALGADREAVAVRRKVGRPIDRLSPEDATRWRAAAQRARLHLTTSEFVGVVFDYDGTLVGQADRYSGPSKSVASALTGLLDQGINVGIATGRGRSVGEDLRASIPNKFWPQVLIGYYNGGQVFDLANVAAPARDVNVGPALAPAVELLAASNPLSHVAELASRPSQVTITPRRPEDFSAAWDITRSILSRAGGRWKCVHSGHSIDVVPTDISKLSVVKAIAEKAHQRVPGMAVIRIGDHGEESGNDAELLSTLDGLSVDRVSRDPEAAWNFASIGQRGVRATLEYCKLLEVTAGAGLRIQGI